MFARAVNPILRVNGENALASDGTLEERYEYTPYGERTRKAGGELPLTPALSRSTQRLSTGRQGKGWARRAVPREKNGPPHPEPPIV